MCTRCLHTDTVWPLSRTYYVTLGDFTAANVGMWFRKPSNTGSRISREKRTPRHQNQFCRGKSVPVNWLHLEWAAWMCLKFFLLGWAQCICWYSQLLWSSESVNPRPATQLDTILFQKKTISKNQPKSQNFVSALVLLAEVWIWNG